MRSQSAWLFTCVLGKAHSIIHRRKKSAAVCKNDSDLCRLTGCSVCTADCRLRVRLLRVLILTGLIGDAAAGLARTLAGSLALAAAALDSAFCHITGIQCHDMLHDNVLSTLKQSIWRFTLPYYMNYNVKSQRPVQACRRPYSPRITKAVQCMYP